MSYCGIETSIGSGEAGVPVFLVVILPTLLDVFVGRSKINLNPEVLLLRAVFCLTGSFLPCSALCFNLAQYFIHLMNCFLIT